MNIKAILVKSFSDNINGGNPTGVIFGDNLSQEQMQKIASILNFSEIVFVLKSDIGDYKFKFFSPIKEVDICAHALIGGICVLNQNLFSKIEYNIETNSGIIKTTINDNLIVMTQKQAGFLSIENDIGKIANLLGLNNNDLLNFPIELVSTGTPKLIIPLKSLNILSSVKPNFDGIKEYCRNGLCRGFYPFTFETIDSSSDVHTRQFNPLAGINEDPITGIAAGALGAYLLKNGIFSKNSFVVEQGYFMSKFGKVFVEVLENKVNVGGKAIIYGEKDITI